METLEIQQPKELIEYTAKSTIELKSSHYYISYISLIWKSRPILLAFNNIENKVFSFWNNNYLDEDDLDLIEDIIIEFLNQ